jgi:hypothetical protein
MANPPRSELSSRSPSSSASSGQPTRNRNSSAASCRAPVQCWHAPPLRHLRSPDDSQTTWERLDSLQASVAAGLRVASASFFSPSKPLVLFVPAGSRQPSGPRRQTVGASKSRRQRWKRQGYDGVISRERSSWRKTLYRFPDSIGEAVALASKNRKPYSPRSEGRSRDFQLHQARRCG